jgi:hypothetical protein
MCQINLNVTSFKSEQTNQIKSLEQAHRLKHDSIIDILTWFVIDDDSLMIIF